MQTQQNQQQKNKTPVKTPSDLIRRIATAKSTLKLQGLNVGAAAAGHQAFKMQASKNPNAQISQVLAKVSPTARQNYLKLTSEVPSEMLSDKTPQNIFRSTLQRLKAQKDALSKLNNSIEILDKEQISESINEEFSPPALILLKRTGIRIFPDGRRVALYTNDKMGLVFSVPYKKGSGVADLIPGVTSEEVELEDVMENLDQVAKYAQEESPKSSSRHMKFSDGSKLKVSHSAAKAIHMVHGALNDENKKKFAEMLLNPKDFTKAANFALSKVEYKINNK